MPPAAAASGSAETLRTLVLDARERTLALVRDLDGERLLGPMLRIVNPPLWETGHVGWFQEHWCLRHAPAGLGPSLIRNADALYNSATVPHDARWNLPLPTFAESLDYLARVLDRVVARLEESPDDRSLQYFAALSALHECMHAEAFTYTRQTLGYAAPYPTRASSQAGPWPGDVVVSGGRFRMGASEGAAFAFDNEKREHAVEIAPFRMARAPITNAEYAAFVEDGGYRSPAWWCEQGWTWRVAAAAESPVYWRRDGGVWRERIYDEHVPLRPHWPVMHVNWYEADAYCRWAGRRLPTEAEWEFAASTVPGDAVQKRRHPWGDEPAHATRAAVFGSVDGRCDVAAYAEGDSAWGCRQLVGNVWEWTADWFAPYPGFAPEAYKEYSAPWFGDHKVLRGGCHATSPALAYNAYRNFYTPDRRDVFAGFRTCALEP